MTNISYVIAQGKANLFKKQDGIADMVANANTVGYLGEKDVFGELLTTTAPTEHLSFSKISTVKRDITPSSMQATARPLDAAIVGDGYFMVETPLGNRFTKAGNFRIDPNGTLVSQEGYPVIGPGGGLTIFAEGDTNIDIKDNGTVTANNEERGQIGVFSFDNEQLLERVGANMYRSNEAPTPSLNFQVAGGMLQNSNVNPISSMTDLMSVARSIESMKRLEKGHHDLQKNMIRTLTRQS